LTPEQIKALIRTVPDFPQPGIQFRDINTLIAHSEGLAAAIDAMAEAAPEGLAAIAGIEARGFIFGSALATRLGLGFLPLRKPGKLPVPSIGQDYSLEYGEARLELDPTLLEEGKPVLLVDDLIATGGTATAGVELLRRAGARCEHAAFVIDLPDLGGATRLTEIGVKSHALLAFEGE